MISFPNWRLHLGYLLILAGLFGLFRFWLSEHDARLAADHQVAADAVQVKSLQEQISARDQQATIQQAPIVRIIHDAITPQQALQSMPELVDVPLRAPITLDSGGNAVVPMPDIMPLFQQFADGKLCKLKLSTATADLVDTKAIVAQRDEEIKTLKKKPAFFHRLASVSQHIAIGIGIGLALGATHL